TAPMPGLRMEAISGNCGAVARTASHHGSTQVAGHNNTTAMPPESVPSRYKDKNIRGNATHTDAGLNNSSTSHSRVITVNQPHTMSLGAAVPVLVGRVPSADVSLRYRRYSRDVPST